LVDISNGLVEFKKVIFALEKSKLTDTTLVVNYVWTIVLYTNKCDFGNS